jgi:lipopolysaccharide export system permease protein
LKKLNKLLLISYIGPFFATFFVALFILLMMFVFKYIDDLVGKGLPWYTVAKLMIYASANQVPLALPLAVLLSSIMTFGNFSEHFELVAAKSAGVSLQRFMRPLIVLVIVISIGAFLFSNYMLPIANLKFGALLYDITHSKPALSIKPGVFYRGIDGYSIKVGKKDANGDTLRNVMIYDQSDLKGNIKLIYADKCTMRMSTDTTVMLADLFNGHSYEDVQDQRNSFYPVMRSTFEREVVRFSLESFKMIKTNENLFKDNFQMLNLRQLSTERDSLVAEKDRRAKELSVTVAPMYGFIRDTIKPKMPQVASLPIHKDSIILTSKNILDNFPKSDRARIADNALNLARTAKSYVDNMTKDMESRSKLIARFEIEWQRKLSLSFACILMFFIGAPFGAIVRKGGLGMPMTASALIFITYHIITTIGEKYSRECVLPAYKGMWLSSLILLPLGIFLTYKATTDSAIFDKDAYVRSFNRVVKYLGRKKEKI